MGDKSVTHDEVVAAVQAHSGRATTPRLAIPPEAASGSVVVDDDVAAHLTTDGPSIVVDDELHAESSMKIAAAENNIMTAGCKRPDRCVGEGFKSAGIRVQQSKKRRTFDMWEGAPVAGAGTHRLRARGSVADSL